MRLNDHQLVQYVEGTPARIVFLDEQIGAEVTRDLHPAVVANLRLRMAEASRDKSGSIKLDGLEIRADAFPNLTFALGYFLGVSAR